MIASAHIDTFTRDHLPPESQRPRFLHELPELQYPDRLNACVEFLDRAIERGWGDRPCIIADDGTLTYAQFLERVNQIANVLVNDLGLVPGNRVL